jgi:hypothetical protein
VVASVLARAVVMAREMALALVAAAEAAHQELTQGIRWLAPSEQPAWARQR